MKSLLRLLIVILLLAIAGSLLYKYRDQFALLSNNRVLIYGDWHQASFNFSEPDVFTFAEEMITKNNQTWGSYRFLTNNRLEVTVGMRTEEYEIAFPEDDEMVWYVRVKGELQPRYHWKR